MAFFEKKNKKLSLDEILKGIDSLSAEEQEQVHAKMQDLYKAEDAREIDKIEEDKADDSKTKNEKAEEVSEESEEIGKDVDEVENEVTEDEETESDPVEEVETEETTEEPTEETETEEVVEEETPTEETEKKIDEHIANDGEMKAWMQSVTKTLEELKQAVAGFARQPKEVGEKESDKLEALARKFD